MDKLWNNIIIEIESDEIKEINVHGIVREIRPGNLVKSFMYEPEPGNGQVMDNGITGYGRGKIKENFGDHKSEDRHV
jgi:activator of 2-hydroxyglutaryl-CoA dehydratase